MGYIHTVNITGDQSYLIEPILFASVAGTNTALTATIPNFSLTPDIMINIKLPFDIGANATLSINNGTAISLTYLGSSIAAGQLKQNFIYGIIYDGTSWNVVGDLTDNDTKIPILYLDGE